MEIRIEREGKEKLLLTTGEWCLLDIALLGMYRWRGISGTGKTGIQIEDSKIKEELI